MALYSLRTTTEGWRIAKFDKDINPLSTYNLRVDGENIACECPQSSRGHCRHIDIFNEFFLRDRINSGWFYDIDDDMWHPPIDSGEVPSPPDPGEVEQGAEAAAEPETTSLAPSAPARTSDRSPPGISFQGDLKGIRRC